MMQDAREKALSKTNIGAESMIAVARKILLSLIRETVSLELPGGPELGARARTIMFLVALASETKGSHRYSAVLTLTELPAGAI